MMQLLAYIRPFTRNLLKSHGRRSFSTAVGFPRRSSWLLAAYRPKISNERNLGFHTSTPTNSTRAEPEVPGEEYPKWLKKCRDADSSWMRENSTFEKMTSDIVNYYTSSLAKAEESRDEIIKLEEKLTDAVSSGKCKCAVGLLPKVTKQKLEFTNLITSETSVLERQKKLQSSLREKMSLIKLRTELFLRFRLAVRQIVEPQLSAKPEKIPGDQLGSYNFALNCLKVDRNSGYSLFLKQFKLELGDLDSFLLGIGIENAIEFFDISEFAMKGDQEAFFHVHPAYWLYYMEEEVSDCVGQFPDEFDRERILELIGKVKYSESMSKNCFKMVDYLSKLI